jgi:GGDEF domain-containing protein
MLCIKIEDDGARANDPDWNTEVQMDFVQVLARSLRAVDLASRTEEREFTLCLPHTAEEGALSLAWRISQNVGQYKVTMRKANAPEHGLDFDELYEKAEAFAPSEPAPKPAEEHSTAGQLEQMVKTALNGEIAIQTGESVRSAKSKLRRASKRAGVDIRIWDENGAVHFERLASSQPQKIAS